MEHYAEGDVAAKVERETGVTFQVVDKATGRHQAVVIVVIRFTTNIGENAEVLGKVVFGNEAKTETKYEVAVSKLLPLPGMKFAVFSGIAVGFGGFEAVGVAETETTIELRVEIRFLSLDPIGVEDKVNKPLTLLNV